MILPDVHLLVPTAAVLALPAAAAWWALRGLSGRWVRALALTLLVFAAMRPELAWGRGGSDVVLVLDRSASMGEARARQDEVVRLVANQRREGDRLAVVLAADGADVAQAPQATGIPRLADSTIDDGGSDLANGLEQAAALIPPGRTGRVIVHSDGENTGLDPRPLAARLALAGIPIDVLPERRPPLADAAILDGELPQELRLGESFLGAVRFIGDRDETRAWRVVRVGRNADGAASGTSGTSGNSGDKVVASGNVALNASRPTTTTFADRPPRGGVVSYRVELDAKDDRQPLNNTARLVLRVTGGERVLVMSGDGKPGNLSQALQASGMAVMTRAEGPLTLNELAGVSTLVLEAVPAERVGLAGMEAIARWVEHLGGGLVMTGGRRSFGSGGWHRSPVERVLPVTMELRDEHRKLAVAMAIALDRSGSMSVRTPDGRQKMDLANEGAAATIELLGPRDQVAVFAVDSEPHEVVPLTPVTNKAALAGRVLGIRSEGGGIYVYAALLAAGKAIAEAQAGTRHIVLFADANDAEEPGDYKNLLEQYTRAGITVSVMAMGTAADQDAKLLEDVAQRGNGRIAYAERAEDIPRLFAQETVLVARSSWIAEPSLLQAKPALDIELGRGEELGGTWPTAVGYNLTYPRERAQVLAMAPGDPAAPAVATWRIGGGRAVAVAVAVDDPKSPEFLAWRGYAPLLAGLVRWASSSGDAPGMLTSERTGRAVTLRLELDPARRAEWPATPPLLTLNQDGEIGAPRTVILQPVDAGRYEAIVRLVGDKTLLPAVVIGDRAVVGPALALPYGPEAEPRHGQRPGDAVLADLARDAGGKVRADLLGAFENPPSPGQLAEAALPLLIAALLLVLAEIAVRRLGLAFRRAPLRKPESVGTSVAPSREPVTAHVDASSPDAPPPDQGLHEALRQLKRRRKE